MRQYKHSVTRRGSEDTKSAKVLVDFHIIASLVN